MFHKENSSVVSKKDTPLRKSDRKRLLQTAIDMFDAAAAASNKETRSTTSEILEDAFLKGSLIQRPLKLPTASVTLYLRSPTSSSSARNDRTEDAAGSLTSAINSWPYHTSTQCLWLQVEESDGSRTVHHVPGLALLALIKDNFPTVTVPTQASKFVCRGANVMRAGMLSITPAPTANNTANNAVVAVAVEGNPQPFAVGLLHPDLLLQTTTVGAVDHHALLFGPGTKGTGVTVVHCYGDDLWRKQLPTTPQAEKEGIVMSEMGGAPFDAGHYGNVGFIDGKYVLPITTKELESQDDDDGEAATKVETPSPDLAVTEGDADDAVPELASDKTETTVDKLSPEEVLHSAVCAALVSLNVKKDLPMLMATFYAQYVLPNRPEGCTVHLKQTKWKKFGAYIAEQVGEGLLTAGPDPSKKDPMGMLLTYDRRHPDLEKYIQQRKEAPSPADEQNKHLVLANLYCIPNHFVALLRLDQDTVKAANATSEERQNTGLLTVKELRGILEDYIAREELVVAARPDIVNLDGPLTDALYKKKKKKNATTPHEPTPTSLSRKELMKVWEACQEPAYALVEVPGNAILKLGRGKPPVVTIEVSRRQSNKFVTHVLGLEAYNISPAAFSKDVAHRFACSATVAPTATATKTSELLFQGNLADELEALLLSDESLTSHGGAKGSTYRLPKDAIDVILRKGVPPRKKRTGKKK